MPLQIDASVLYARGGGSAERQKRDGMCWRDPDELYNGGNAFKISCRDHRGVMVTIIADNYYGYCKKEVKTQISLRGEPLRPVRRRTCRRRDRLRRPMFSDRSSMPAGPSA